MSKNTNGKTPKLEVTSATEWRKLREEGVIVPLPSGFVARLRPVGIEELVRRGRIPDQLTVLAAETVWQGTPSPEQIKATSKGALEFLNIVVASAFKEPRVVLEGDPGEGEISIDDIDVGDKQAVFVWVTAPTTMLTRFRAEQKRNLAPVPDGEDDGAAPE
jgi:hypothetical protein